MIDEDKTMAWMNLAFNIIILVSIALTPVPTTAIGKLSIYLLIAFLAYDSVEGFMWD